MYRRDLLTTAYGTAVLINKPATCIPFLAALLLAGCDLSRELNENTLAISSTVSQIHNEQIIENLELIIEDGYAIPAQVTLSGGGVQVTNQFNPTFMNFIQPWKTFSASYTNSYTQNWAVSPVNDPDDIRRLRALYRFTVYGYHGSRAGGYDEYGRCRRPVDPDFCTISKEADFDIEYPRPVISDTAKSKTDTTQPATSTNAVTKQPETATTTTTPGVGGAAGTSTTTTQPKAAPSKTTQQVTTTTTEASTSTSTTTNATVLNPENCQKPTIADRNPSCPAYPYFTPNYLGADNGPSGTLNNEAILDHLKLPADWLFWSPAPFGGPLLPYPYPKRSDCVLIWSHYFSTATFHSLYSCAPGGYVNAWKQFDEFAVWVSGATINSLGLSGGASNSGSQGGGGGGGGGKPKGAAASVLTNPVGSSGH